MKIEERFDIIVEELEDAGKPVFDLLLNFILLLLSPIWIIPYYIIKKKEK